MFYGQKRKNDYQIILLLNMSFVAVTYLLGHVKQKRVFKYAQKVWIYIILCMRKVSSGPLLSIDTFYCIQWAATAKKSIL